MCQSVLSSVTDKATQGLNRATSTSGETIYATGTSGYNYSMAVTANTATGTTTARPSAGTNTTAVKFTVGFRGSYT